MRGFALGTACLIVVSLAACHDPDSYQLLSPTNPNGTPVESILDLIVPTSSPRAIPAYGGSRTLIEAKIDPSSTVRSISFTTTHGTLLARGRSTSETAPTLTIDADSAGVAVVELQAATQPATAMVTASVSIPGTPSARTI